MERFCVYEGNRTKEEVWRKKLDLESKVECPVLTYSLCIVAYIQTRVKRQQTANSKNKVQKNLEKVL